MLDLTRVTSRLKPGKPLERAALAIGPARQVAEKRARTLLATVAPGTAHDAPLAAVEEWVVGQDIELVWLAMCTLTAELPISHHVARMHRLIALEGGHRLVRESIESIGHQMGVHGTPPEVSILEGVTVVDVHHTSLTHLNTGIQRVVRETTRRWARDHDVTLVGWVPGQRGLHLLSQAAIRTALHGVPNTEPPVSPHVVVPWKGVYLIPELMDHDRSMRALSLLLYSGCRSGGIGYDCVPLTMRETTNVGMGGAFAGWLAAARELDRIGTISAGARREYEGWGRMLGGHGTLGPQIREVMLAAGTAQTEPAVLERMRLRHCTPGWPMVLVVGTHEPRKNHLAVLHAAELLWREGQEFTLAFIGGSGWGAQEFLTRVAELRAAGRPVEDLAGVSDEDLWAAYRLATVTVFPSLNEGFGLPVAEALACGTPAITSNFGSMAEIAADGGADLVDPRDDADLARVLRRVLTDPDHLTELRHQAARRPLRDWDAYAAELWDFLVEGV